MASTHAILDAQRTIPTIEHCDVGHAKPVRKKCFIAFGLIVTGFLSFHLGPFLHFAKRAQVIDTLRLQDGSQLILSQRANPSLVEAYTVTLYRSHPDGRAEKCGVGCEESYWWFGALKSKSTNTIELRSCGLAVCTYNTETKVLSWNDNSYPPHTSEPPTYISVPK